MLELQNKPHISFIFAANKILTMKNTYKYILGVVMISATMFTCASSHEVCPAYGGSIEKKTEKI